MVTINNNLRAHVFSLSFILSCNVFFRLYFHARFKAFLFQFFFLHVAFDVRLVVGNILCYSRLHFGSLLCKICSHFRTLSDSIKAKRYFVFLRPSVLLNIFSFIIWMLVLCSCNHYVALLLFYFPLSLVCHVCLLDVFSFSICFPCTRSLRVAHHFLTCQWVSGSYAFKFLLLSL